jgi:hypothetical protein
MKVLAWLAVLVSLACGVVFALVGVPGGPSGGPGGGFLADVLAEAERGRRLDDLSGACVRRICAKHRLAEEVIAGRLGLRQAAARFRELNEQPSAYDRERFRALYPGADDGERHCREVLAWVADALEDDPDPGGADLVTRLEAELQESKRSRAGRTATPCASPPPRFSRAP